MDAYQERYLKHQERKRKELNGIADYNKPFEHSLVDISALMEVIESRRSRRLFSENKHIKTGDLNIILGACEHAPSSCNRGAIDVITITDSAKKRKVSALLVGGIGWAKNADIILLFLADIGAYKAPGEIRYMPYLDTGFMAQNAYLASEILGISACFINPNIRRENRDMFYDSFCEKGKLFCGAMALGIPKDGV